MTDPPPLSVSAAPAPADLRPWEAPPWARAVVDVYFELYPFEETMAAYRAQGLLCSQYWYRELKRLLTARWRVTDPTFAATVGPALEAAGVLDRYAIEGGSGGRCPPAGGGRGGGAPPVVEVGRLGKADRQALLAGFCNALGMHTGIFPYRVEDFEE
jgi:hypothetical protein